MTAVSKQPIADAHIHLFDPGFAQGRPEAIRQITPTELTLYDELTRRHNIESAVVVAYEGDAWAKGNNDYLAALVGKYAWLRPVAYIHDPRDLDIAALDQLAARGFVGISLYVFPEGPEDPVDSDDSAAARQDARITRADPAVWQWLAEHGWLVSVNSTGARWYAWQAVLQQRPGLRLLLSHLGLPPRLEASATAAQVHENLAPILSLADAPNVTVKLSGLYALSDPGYAYPHVSAWPYIETILTTYGTERVVWGSDFIPALDKVSFVQTVHLLDTMPFLDDLQRRAIQYENLSRMLNQVDQPGGNA